MNNGSSGSVRHEGHQYNEGHGLKALMHPVIAQMERHKMPHLSMHRHRGAVKQPQALMREVLRLKVAQMKEAAWLQLQQREPVIFQGALGDAPLSRRMFCTRRSRESETLQANDIANVTVHGIELTRAELASFHNTLKW